MKFDDLSLNAGLNISVLFICWLFPRYCVLQLSCAFHAYVFILLYCAVSRCWCQYQGVANVLLYSKVIVSWYCRQSWWRWQCINVQNWHTICIHWFIPMYTHTVAAGREGEGDIVLE